MRDCAYFGRVLRVVERRHRGRGLTIYLTWDVKRLPSYGDSVVAVVLGDEWCRRPAYAASIRAVFKCYGEQLMLGPIRGLDMLSLLTILQWLRTSLVRVPFRLRGCLDWVRGRRANVYDIPLGYLNQIDLPVVPLAARKHDVWFAGSLAQQHVGPGSIKAWLGTPKLRARRRMIEALERVRALCPQASIDLQLTADFRSSVLAAAPEYSASLQHTRICVAPRGTSFETFRWFEALRYGCVVVGEPLPARRYYDGAPYVRIDDWREADGVLRGLLADPERMQRLHERSLDWWQRHCSEEAVGDWIAARLPPPAEAAGRRMIRVAFIDQSGDAAGGAEESLALLLRYLPADIEPQVFVFNGGAFARRLRGYGIPVETLPVAGAVASVRRERPSIGAALHAVRVVMHLARALRRRRPDVVYTNTVKAHLLGGVAARLSGIPTIAHYRDLLEGAGLGLTRIAARFSGGRRVAITNAVDAWYGLGATTVIDEPLELASFRDDPRDAAGARRRLGLPADGVIVGIVGRINRWKGHDRFLAAAARIAAVAPQTRFAIVGAPIFRDEDFAEELHDLTEQLGIADRVSFVPWTEDVRDVYAAIDVHCNCSTREPFGRTTVEAAAAGVPTVCFSDGGAAEAMIPGVTGIAVPSGDVAAFAAAVLQYVGDAERRREDGESARRFIARYDARVHGERVAEVIRSAATERRHG